MKNREALAKVAVFSLFIFGSIVLVLSIWTNRLTEDNSGIPGYVRATLAIPTSEDYEMTLEALPTKDHAQGAGGGQGGGQHNGTLTPTPTFNVDDWVTEEGLSSDLADE